MYGDIEITKREVIASVIIICIMLLLGVLAFGGIQEWKMDVNEIYNKAIKIDSSELFRYSMDTDVGYAFVQGDWKTLDPVTYPEIGGEYLEVEKIKEEYTRHTRKVTTTVNGKATTRTEVYWTWDKVGEEEKTAKKVEFCGVEFDSSQFKLPSTDYIKTIKESYYIRYKYYGSKTEYSGTIFSDLRDGNIEGKGVSFYVDKDLEQAYEYATVDFTPFVFWFLWIILTGGVVYGFYYLDNEWLNK